MRKRQQTSRRGNALARLAAKGRFGDTELVHVNKREAALLKALGGSGTVNPKTGFREFFMGDRDFGGWGQPSNEHGSYDDGPQNDQKEGRNDPVGIERPGGNSASNGVNRRGTTYSGPKGVRGLNKAARQAAANSVGLSSNTIDDALGDEDEQGGLIDVLSNGKSVKVDDLTLNPRGKFVGAKTPTQSFVNANPHLGGMHSPEMQAAYNDITRGAAGIGVSKSEELSQSQKDVLRSLSNFPVAQRLKANEFYAKNNPIQSFFSSLGSRVIPGVNSVGSYSLDEEDFGTPGQFGGYNPVEATMGYLSRAHGLAGAIGVGAQIADFAGYDIGKSYDGFTSEKLGSAYSRDSRARRSVSKEGEQIGKSLSLSERASQQLYPEVLPEEDQLNLAVGVTQGKSPVRRAPNLSALKARRANFGRVR